MKNRINSNRVRWKGRSCTAKIESYCQHQLHWNGVFLQKFAPPYNFYPKTLTPTTLSKCSSETNCQLVFIKESDILLWYVCAGQLSLILVQRRINGRLSACLVFSGDRSAIRDNSINLSLPSYWVNSIDHHDYKATLWFGGGAQFFYIISKG